MLLSSCVIWRHREWSDFRARVPGRRRAAAAARLGAARRRARLAGLARRAGRRDETGNPRTVGMRFDPRGADRGARRACRADRARCRRQRRRRADDPLHRRLRRVARARGALRRGRGAAPAAGEPVVAGRRAARAARRAARALTGGMDEFYGRNMPDAPWDETQFVVARRSSTRASRASSTSDGVEFFERDDVSWSETNVVQATARRPGAPAYYLLDERGARASACASARSPRSSRRRRPRRASPLEDLPFAAPPGAVAAVRVVAVDHAHDRRPARRRARARAGEDGRRSTASAPPASTPAASRPAATRAGSRRRSCSASPRPRRGADA